MRNVYSAVPVNYISMNDCPRTVATLRRHHNEALLDNAHHGMRFPSYREIMDALANGNAR
jgi:hypothetical protein